MTGKDIRFSAELYVGRDIEDDIVLCVINEALDSIMDLGLVFEEEGINAEAGVWTTLPKTVTNILSVEDSNGEPYDKWEQKRNRIRLAHSGAYTINYRISPTHIQSMDEEPDTHPIFHRAIVNYLRSFILMIGNKEPHPHMATEKFQQDILNIHQQIKRKRTPKQVRVIRNA